MTPTRFIYYYEGDVDKLTPTEKGDLGNYIHNVHKSDGETVEGPHTSELRHLETVEEPTDFYDFSQWGIEIDNYDNFSHSDVSDSGVVTVDTFIE